MSFMEKLREKVLNNPGRIVLPEGKDPRVVQAARELLDQKLVTEITILGASSEIEKAATEVGVSLDGIQTIDPTNATILKDMAATYFELRKHKGISEEDALNAAKKTLNFGALMLKNDLVDGMVGGCIHATADVLRSAITIVKPMPGMKTVSSCFAMLVPNKDFGVEGSMIYADCGAVPNPNAEQLADIAIAAASSCKQLLGVEPVVAMLSFSTMGSASDPIVDKVIEATKIAKSKAPDLMLDGEMQADAALIPSIGSKKAPNSNVAGKANTLIFPDLNAGNIAYKLTERLTGGEAYGPLLQGLSKPVNDLSRGCKASDIVNVAIITQAQGMK